MVKGDGVSRLGLRNKRHLWTWVSSGFSSGISAQSNLWISCTQRGTLLNGRNGFGGITQAEEAWNWDQFVDKNLGIKFTNQRRVRLSKIE